MHIDNAALASSHLLLQIPSWLVSGSGVVVISSWSWYHSTIYHGISCAENIFAPSWQLQENFAFLLRKMSKHSHKKRSQVADFFSNLRLGISAFKRKSVKTQFCQNASFCVLENATFFSKTQLSEVAF